mmetsp:Transcript_24172/g.37157  ORF Transcript_24172/g.37157 Transcript_24172/m.37157 type:complete len:254 (+) Transcript_24172:1367-2128(+)
MADLLSTVSSLKVKKRFYNEWTACVGGFMQRMGGPKFFKILPLQLTAYDLNSFTYAQDSKSWLITLVANNLKDANLDFFADYFLPEILKLDKMRDLEKKDTGSEIKMKKYETMIAQIWMLLPIFCHHNSPNMSAKFSQILTYLDPIVDQDVLSLRPVGLKSFSALIQHCRDASNVDNEIKKTRRGLQNIAIGYIEKLVNLYTKEQEKCEQEQRDAMKQLLLTQMSGSKKLEQEIAVKAKFYRSKDQSQVLVTL